MPIVEMVHRILFDGHAGSARRRRADGARASSGARRMSPAEPVQEFFSHRRGLRAHRPQAARAALLGKPVPLSQPGEESLGESRLPAARGRADHAREAPAVHREVHDRRRAPESGRASEGRGPASGARAARSPCRRSRRSRRSCKELIAMLARRRTRPKTRVACAFSSRTTTASSRTASSACRGRGAARRGHRRRARSRAERDEPLAHAASSAAAGAARRAPMAGRRHADRLRHARGRGADAGAAGLRAQRHQPRAEHGRGRAVLGHGRRGDGGARARHSVDRHLVRRRRPPRGRDAAAASR